MKLTFAALICISSAAHAYAEDLFTDGVMHQLCIQNMIDYFIVLQGEENDRPAGERLTEARMINDRAKYYIDQAKSKQNNEQFRLGFMITSAKLEKEVITSELLGDTVRPMFEECENRLGRP